MTTIKKKWNGKPILTNSNTIGNSKTKTNFKDQVNINKIMSRANRTGQIPFEDKERTFADVSDIGDYRESLEKIKNADAEFMELPSDVRSRFSNDPGQLIDFIKDPKNIDEARELGLARMPKIEPPIEKLPVEKPAPEPAPK